MNQRVHMDLMEFHSINSYCYFCFIDSNHLILKVQFISFFFYCYSFESKLECSVSVVLTQKYDEEVTFHYVFVHCFSIHFFLITVNWKIYMYNMKREITL